MITLTHTYQNGHMRSFNVVSAEAGEDGAILLTTADDGVIAVCPQGMPELHAAIIAAGLL
jgi:hypothetical protein